MKTLAITRSREAADDLAALRATIVQWEAAVRNAAPMGGHETQLASLRETLLPLLDGVEAQLLVDSAPGTPIGAVYAASRRADARGAFIRRLWRWYADRFDQRHDPADAHVLAAAEEVVWSVWKRAFDSVGAGVPAAPLVFLTPEPVAWANRDDALPAGTHPPSMDPFFADWVRRLPVGVVGLPTLVRRRSWWLTVAVHEVGHHLLPALSPTLIGDTADAIVVAARASGADPATAECWRPWTREIVADAISVVYVGRAAIWTVVELERTHLPELDRPRPTYPPPRVRVELMRELLARLHAAPPATVWDDMAGEDGADVGGLSERLLPAVPRIAGALQTLALGQQALGALAGDVRARARAQHRWRRAFDAGNPVAEQAMEAAADCVAGATRHAAERRPLGKQAAALSSQIVDVTAACRPVGSRAAPSPLVPEQPDMMLAELLAAELPSEATGW